MKFEVKVWNSTNPEIEWIDFIKVQREDGVFFCGCTSDPRKVESIISELKEKLSEI